MRIGYICTSLAALLMAACAAPTPREPLKGHLNGDNAPVAATGSIPPPVQQTLALPKPRPTRKAMPTWSCSSAWASKPASRCRAPKAH